MTTTPSHGPAVLAAARSCLGTPYHHAGQIPHVGLDCWGLVAVSLRAAGFDANHDTSYPVADHYKQLTDYLATCCDRHTNEIAGDILIFRSLAVNCHCGIANGQGGMVHVLNGSAADRVVECPISPAWRKRQTHSFRLKDNLWQR